MSTGPDAEPVLPGPARRAVLPRGLLGMIALIAAVELGIVTRDTLRFTERIPDCWRYAGHEARGQAVWEADVLCLGDSQIKLGVVPAWIEARTGLPAFNLAVPGGQAPSTYVLFRRALEAGARPGAVVVGYFPGLLAINQMMNLRCWPELLDTRETLDLALSAGSGPLFVRITLARLLPSVRKRDEIRARVVGLLRGEPDANAAVVLAHRRNWTVNHGAQLMPVVHDFADTLDATAHAEGRGRPWRPDPTNARYIERLLTLAGRHDVAVYWLLPTISPAWQAHRESNGLDADYVRYVQSLQARHRHLTVLDGRHAGYDSSAFRDAFHLTRRGAEALSADLGTILARGPDPTHRWVSLPLFSPRPAHPALEDVEQSRLALDSLSDDLRVR